MQSAIHEGYEYQDYFSVSIILQLMLQRKDAEIIVDRKDFNGDKFDDLKVKLSNGITEFQIKYSDEESSHNLTKSDLSNGNGHDTALYDLFASWKTRKESKNNTEIKLCLAWGRPADDDPIAKFLKPIQEHTMPFSTVAYSFDGAAFWPAEDTPPKTWKKFNLKIKSEPIEREDFLAFCNELTFILEMPKASLDLKKPGDIENVIIQQVEKLGVGIYPNDNLRVEDVIGKLAMEVKHSRAIGNKLYTNVLMGRLGLIADYGKFDQRFPVDSAHQIILSDEIERLHQVIRDSKQVIISGNPGSGKSWLVDEYIDKIKKENSKVIHYNCFQSLQDINSLERIRVDSLYGNLVSQIVEQCPELIEHKKTILGADKAELENLLCLIGEEIYLIVDGLDHISREYELHKDLISRSETEIISELLEIQFPDNCYVLISSQPIKALENFRTRNYGVFEIESWKIDQVKSLMETFHIKDNIIENDDTSSISEYLLKKSQGNALYLSYILRQLRNSDVNKELIDEIPDYDISLSKYYSYLYTKIHNNRTVNALCGADFYLSSDDLMEITGDGEFVEHDISVLQPLLIENISNGGFSIYHESFRRFVLALLKEKKVDLERNVYGILADWLQEKPFFEFNRSFYYLTELLYKIKRDTENTALIEKKFVLKSVSEGYSRKYIRKNLNCIIRSAGRSENLVALVIAGELLAMLDDLNEFESTGEEYLQAISDIKGASKLNQLMQIDGEPTFEKDTGQLACYISSKAGVKPWWELYLDTDTKQVEIENFKYYLRYNLDEQGVSIIPDLMETIEKDDVSVRNECIEIAYDELRDYIENTEIASIAENRQLMHWKRYLSYIENGYYPQTGVSFEDTIGNWEKIRKLKMPGEEDVRIFKEFFSQIYYLAKQENKKAIETILGDYSSRQKDIILQIINQLELDNKEMSEIHMLMYLYSYEWGSSLMDKDEFVNSMRLNSDVARDIFYREVPEVIILHSGRITKGLLDALWEIEFNKESIIMIWRGAFDIMKLRFPNLDQYSVDNVLMEKDELSELRNCLLLRFIDGGKESFLATYAYLANAAEEEKYSEFTKSIVFCLEQYEKYNLVTQIAIADLVKCYGFHLRKLDRERVINAINTVYPTGNLLLDAIFSELTIYKNFLLNHYDKHVPDYMEQEDIEFYLSEELYDLGKEKAQKEIDKYAKNSIYRDPIMGVIKSCGIDYMNLYKKLHTSKILNEKMQNFIGASSKIPEINTVYKSYVIQYALHAIIEKAFRDRKPELIPQNLLRLVPDYQGMYRLFKCRKIQPQNHLYDKANSCELFLPSNEDEYILIGAFEKKLHIDYKQASCIFAYQGIIGLDDKKQKKPFQECLAPRVETGEIYVIIENSVALINLIKTLDRELEDENYLLPENSVFKLFNVHIKFDFLHRRYIAVNQENDIIFIMKKWSSSYKGDSEYLGNVIPLYSGTELYIKREYIGMLEQQFGTLMMETCVEACTQTY